MRDGKLLTARIDASLFEALKQYADSNHGGSTSTAVRELLMVALQNNGGLQGLRQASLKGRGYADGLRRGLHEARTAIRTAVDGLWENT